jgi:hypothetical protein
LCGFYAALLGFDKRKERRLGKIDFGRTEAGFRRMETASRGWRWLQEDGDWLQDGVSRDGICAAEDDGERVDSG